MNSIVEKQNTEQSIRLLKAQRVMYGRAKSWQLSFEYSSAIVALTLPAIYILTPEYKTTAGFIATFLSMIALGVDLYQKHLTKIAASIQDMFDRNVFELEPGKFHSVEEVSSNIIIELASNYKKNDVTNWYSEYIDASIPQKIAVALCQKANLHWDSELRRKFKKTVWLFIIVYFMLFIIALAAVCKVTDVFLFDIGLLISGSSAFIKYAVTVIAEKSDMIKEKTKLNIEIDKMIDTYSETGNEPKASDLEDIQRIIFASRKKSIKIPDAFYYWHKPKQEKNMNETTLAIVKDKLSKQKNK